MGSQFSFIYDIIVVAVLAAAVFSGAHKGFVSKVVGLAAGLVGFICAISLSGPVGNWAYSSFVEKPLSEAVSTTLDESMAASRSRRRRYGFRQGKGIRSPGDGYSPGVFRH